MQVQLSELVDAHATLYDPENYRESDDTDVESVMFTLTIGGTPVTVRTERDESYIPPLGDDSEEKYRGFIEAEVGAPPIDWTGPDGSHGRGISPTESDPQQYVYYAVKEAFDVFRNSPVGASVSYHAEDHSGKLQVNPNGEIDSDSWDSLSMATVEFRMVADCIEGHLDVDTADRSIIPLSMDIGGESLYAYHFPGGYQLFLYEEPDDVFDGGLDSPVFGQDVPHYTGNSAGSTNGAATTLFVTAGCFNASMFTHLIENATADCSYVNDELDDGQPLPESGNVVNDAGEA